MGGIGVTGRLLVRSVVACILGAAVPIATHGRETQVYRKVDGAWRLVHVHYSGMPVTGERLGF